LAHRSTPEKGLPLATGGAVVAEPPVVVAEPPVVVALVVVALAMVLVGEGSAAPGWHWE
jgi:hypothetical protein